MAKLEGTAEDLGAPMDAGRNQCQFLLDRRIVRLAGMPGVESGTDEYPFGMGEADEREVDDPPETSSW